MVIYARLLHRCRGSFSRATFRSVFEFGGPLVTMNLAMWVLGSSDIYLLRRFAATAQALSEVGLYQYAHEICLLLVLPVTALNLAWPQFLFSNYTKPDGRALFARVHSYFSFFLVEIAFLLAAFSGQIVRLVGSSGYAGSAGVIPLLAGSLLFYGFSIIFASGLYVTGQTRLLAAIVGACAALNVVLNIALIPRLGKQGAALATLVTNLVMMITVLAFAQARFRIPFKIRPTYWGVLLAGAVVGSLALLSKAHPAAAGVLPRLAVSCGFSLALFALLGMRPGDALAAFRTLTSIARSDSPRGR
jgi:O-antigen/teichoic acid export membrane protein